MQSIGLMENIRIALKLSEQEFIKILGIQLKYYRNIKRSSVIKSERLIRLLIYHFNVRSEYLKTGEGAIFLQDIPISNPPPRNDFSVADLQKEAFAQNSQDSLRALIECQHENEKLKIEMSGLKTEIALQKRLIAYLERTIGDQA